MRWSEVDAKSWFGTPVGPLYGMRDMRQGLCEYEQENTTECVRELGSRVTVLLLWTVEVKRWIQIIGFDLRSRAKLPHTSLIRNSERRVPAQNHSEANTTRTYVLLIGTILCGRDSQSKCSWREIIFTDD